MTNEYEPRRLENGDPMYTGVNAPKYGRIDTQSNQAELREMHPTVIPDEFVDPAKNIIAEAKAKVIPKPGEVPTRRTDEQTRRIEYDRDEVIHRAVAPYQRRQR
ncbi:MAG: hypothetical protein M3P98_03185 [bacterium]|nr:hypothetical protein [bacterium]